MPYRPLLIAAVAAALAGVSACDRNVEEDRESSRYVPKVNADRSEASSGPTRAPQRNGDASTRGEPIEEAHRTAPENTPSRSDAAR
jgi:hypothetical protein